MTPPPMNPTPARMPCMTRLTAPSSGPLPSGVESSASRAASAVPRATRACVRRPAGLWCHSRLSPIAAPHPAASSSRPAAAMVVAGMVIVSMTPSNGVVSSRTGGPVSKTRLEAFSDGVIAIIITIMVLELKVPLGSEWRDLAPLCPHLLTYIMSFIYVGIYWSNHHHMLHATTRVDGRVLWANLHLLFWLSLIPVATAWLGETGIMTVPVALYGVVLICAAVAYTILQTAIVACEGPEARLRAAVGRDFKGKLSIAFYAAAILVSF